jgi:predicted transcriptional regulator
MENFGKLQYIIDRLPPVERQVVTEFFVHETNKTEIARQLGISVKVVNRILQNLRKIDLTGDEPMITLRGKTFALRGLNGRS